jgi:hypothetical protein
MELGMSAGLRICSPLVEKKDKNEKVNKNY